MAFKRKYSACPEAVRTSFLAILRSRALTSSGHVTLISAVFFFLAMGANTTYWIYCQYGKICRVFRRIRREQRHILEFRWCEMESFGMCLDGANVTRGPLKSKEKQIYEDFHA
jgi:hypothetical protein